MTYSLFNPSLPPQALSHLNLIPHIPLFALCHVCSIPSSYHWSISSFLNSTDKLNQMHKSEDSTLRAIQLRTLDVCLSGLDYLTQYNALWLHPFTTFLSECPL